MFKFDCIYNIYFQTEDRVNSDIQKAQLYAARASKKQFKQKRLKTFDDDDDHIKGLFPFRYLTSDRSLQPVVRLRHTVTQLIFASNYFQLLSLLTFSHGLIFTDCRTGLCKNNVKYSQYEKKRKLLKYIFGGKILLNA